MNPGVKKLPSLFRSAVQTNRSACARLTKDIDLGSTSFDPILMEWEYEGVFDGAGHTINGFKGWCFFNTVKGVVKNLNIKGVVECNDNYGAAFASLVAAEGEIINCSFEGTLTGRKDQTSFTDLKFQVYGGIAAQNYGHISYCHTKGTFDAYGTLGGIVGRNNFGGTQAVIDHCYNEADLIGWYGVGGICGTTWRGDSKITDCYNKGILYGQEGCDLEQSL